MPRRLAGDTVLTLARDLTDRLSRRCHRQPAWPLRLGRRGRVAGRWCSWSNRRPGPGFCAVRARPRLSPQTTPGGRQRTGNIQSDCPKLCHRTAACWYTTPSGPSGRLRAGKGGEVPGIGSRRRTIRWRCATAALRPNWASITASGPADRPKVWPRPVALFLRANLAQPVSQHQRALGLPSWRCLHMRSRPRARSSAAEAIRIVSAVSSKTSSE